MIPELPETTKKLDIAPNTLAIDFVESLQEDTKVELRSDWSDWLSGYSKKACISYLKLFAPRASVGRLYLYTHPDPNVDYQLYEVYLGKDIPENANA